MMDYHDTRSSSRAQLKCKGKKRSQGWGYHKKNQGHRDTGGKGAKAGRSAAWGALQRHVGAEEGLRFNDAFDDQRTKVPESRAKRSFVEEYERETERYLRPGICAGVAEMSEGVDQGERFEGSSVCDSLEDWLSGMEERFEMLDLSSSSSSEASVSDDGWAIVPDAGWLIVPDTG